jgi:primosomal protein N'
MDTFDCPFCDEPLAVDESMVEARCDACNVTAVIAPDPERPASLQTAA